MRTKRRKRKRRKKRVERKNRSSVFPFFFPFSLLLVYTFFVLFFFQSVQTIYQDFLSQAFFYLSRGRMLRMLIPT